MKEIGIFLLFAAAAGSGFCAAYELKRRKTQLSHLKKALFFLEREIDYKVSSLSEAFLHTAKKAEYPWASFFERIGTRLGKENGRIPDICDVIGEEIKNVKKLHPWERDLKILFSLGQGLGALDKSMQLLQVKSAREEIEKELGEAEEEEKKKGRLYQSLGLCGGVLFVILLL